MVNSEIFHIQILMLSCVITSWKTEMEYTNEYLHDVYNLFHKINICSNYFSYPDRVSASHKHVIHMATHIQFDSRTYMVTSKVLENQLPFQHLSA